MEDESAAENGRGREVGAEVADEAAGFFGGALGVEGDESLEDLFVRQRGRPAALSNSAAIHMSLTTPSSSSSPSSSYTLSMNS
jgi:hypothetical protein